MSTAALVLSPSSGSGSAESMAEEAYQVIRSKIISLEFEPGSLMSEQDLMNQLGFGRTPIREAIRLLANEHLVDVYPRRGMFVAGVDVKNLSALSEVRATLEIKAAALAAERSTPEEREETIRLINEIDRLEAKPEKAALINLDQRIHHHIYACTHNEFLESTLNQYYAHALRIWFLALEKIDNLSEAIVEHRSLLEAMRDNDSEVAAKAMREHVEGFETNIRKSL